MEEVVDFGNKDPAGLTIIMTLKMFPAVVVLVTAIGSALR